MTSADELKQLVTELHANQAAQKAREKRDNWTKYVSLTMVIIAVLAAVATLKGGGFSTRSLKEMNEATFNQAQASDQWAFYEAKSIKQNLYEIELERLENAATANAAATEKLKNKIAKYDKDKAEITSLAKDFEAKRDDARKTALKAAEHSRQMGFSITLFQITVALGAMCLIVKKKPLWIVSIIFGGFHCANDLCPVFFTHRLIVDQISPSFQSIGFPRHYRLPGLILCRPIA